MAVERRHDGTGACDSPSAKRLVLQRRCALRLAAERAAPARTKGWLPSDATTRLAPATAPAPALELASAPNGGLSGKGALTLEYPKVYDSPDIKQKYKKYCPTDTAKKALRELPRDSHKIAFWEIPISH